MSRNYLTRLRRLLPESEVFDPVRENDDGFRRMLLAITVSTVGDWLGIIAVYSLFVFNAEIGVAGVGLLVVMQSVPKAVLGPILGTYVDQYGGKRTLVVAEVLSAGVVGILLFDTSNVLFGYIFFALIEIINSFTGPAYKSTMPQLVDDENIKQANGLLNLIEKSSMIVGPAVAGALLTVAPPEVLLGFDAATFLFSAAVLYSIPKSTIRLAESDGISSDFLEGLRFVFTSSPLFLIVVVSSSFYVMMGGYKLFLPLFVKELLTASTGFYSLLLTAAAIGGIGGGTLIAKEIELNTIYQLLLINAMFSVVLLVFSVTQNKIIIFGLSVLVGVASAGTSILSLTAFQVYSDTDKLGRVTSLLSATERSASLIGMAVLGWSISAVGLKQSALFAGGLLLVVTAPTALLVGRRNLDTTSEAT